MPDYYRCLFFLLGFLSGAIAKINIIELKVPSAVQNGSTEDLILDCDFVAVDEEGIEVKWFYEDNTPIYQWIPNVRKPQALGNFKDRIDVNFKASNDSNTMYRALRINEITPDLAGEYTCKITSYNDEAYETKKLIIYEPVKEFEFIHIVDDDKVICTANGVFPRPDLTITIVPHNGTATTYDDDDDDDDDNDDNDDDTDVYLSDSEPNAADENLEMKEESDDDDEAVEVESRNEFIVSQNDDDTFNLTRVLGYKRSDLPGVTKFICELSIPDTSYSLRRSLERYSGVQPPTVAAPAAANRTFLLKYSELINLMFAIKPTNSTSFPEENGSWTQLPNVEVILASAAMIFFTRAGLL